MKKISYSAFIFLISITSYSFANTKTAELRTSLLNSVRSNYPYLEGTKFKVNKIEYFKNYAYICSTAVDMTGDAVKRDALYEVYDMLMQTGPDNKWNEIANFNSFSSTEKPNCHLNNGIEDFLSKESNTPEKCNELDTDNSVRKEILNTLRTTNNEKFLTTRVCASSKTAYYCGTRQDKDGLTQGTDEAIVVDDMILRKKADGTWGEMVQLGLFATSSTSIQCHFGAPGVILTDATLQNTIMSFDTIKH